MKFLKFVAAIALVLACGWVVTGIAGKHILAAPDSARIVVDVEQYTYASPPCAVTGKTERDLILHEAPRQPTFRAFAVVKTMGEVREDQKKDGRWRADRKCLDADGFVQEQTIWARIFGQASRWTDDGKWRW